MKYRIEEIDGWFYPQKKGLLWGWNYFYTYLGRHVVTKHKVKFSNIDSAIHYFDIKITAAKTPIPKYHYIENPPKRKLAPNIYI